MPESTRALAVLLLLACAGVPSRAADDPVPRFEPYEMGDVTVTADAPRPPTSVTTELTAEAIEAAHARTAAEALALAPGLRVSAGRKDQPNVSIHGFDQSRILVLIDGVPYYETNYGKLDLNQVPADNIARIEVLKTAPSALYGANALGGAINIVTRAPGERASTQLLAEGGENGARRFSASRGETLGRFGYWANVAWRKADAWDLSSDFVPKLATVRGGPSPVVLQQPGQRVNSDVDQRTAWAKAGYESDRGNAYYVNLHQFELDKGTPVATDSAQVNTARPAFSTFARIPLYRDRGIDLDGRQKLGAKVSLTEKIFYHAHVDDYVSYKEPELTTKLATSRYEDELLGAIVSADGTVSKTLRLRGALDLRHDRHDERDDTYLPFARSVSNTGTAAFEAEWKGLAQTTVVASLGYDWFRVTESAKNVTDRRTGDFLRQDPNPTASLDALSPVLSVSRTLGDRTELFLAAAHKTRFPTLSQLYSSKGGNPDLQPETSDNLSIGVHERLTDTLRFEASLFGYDVSHLISRDGPDRTNVYRNYGEARMLGGEIAFDAAAAKNVVLHLDYTYNHVEERGEGHVTYLVVNAPRHRAGWAVSYRIAPLALRLDLDGSYTSEVYTSLPTPAQPTAAVKRAAASAVWGLRAGIEVLKAWELYAAVRNVFDRDYESEPGYPAPGRTIAFGLQGKF